MLAPGTAEAPESIGIDLASGAFVRAISPVSGSLAPFDVAAAELDAGAGVDELSPPESVVLSSLPRRLGRLTGRRAERYLTPLRHPRRHPLLGFSGPAIPYWMSAGGRPTVALVQPEHGPTVVGGADGLRCRFRWHGMDHDLPVDPGRPLSVPAPGARRYRLVVFLAPPRGGYCYKMVAGLLAPP